MYPPMQNDDDEEGEEELYRSGEENDDGFNEDLEALRRACTIAGTNLNNNYNDNNSNTRSPSSASGSASDDYDDDDFELFRSINNRFSVPTTEAPPLSLKPLCALPPVDFEEDNDEDYDFETLRAVQRRFAAYHNTEKGEEDRKAVKVFPDTEEEEGARTNNNQIEQYQPLDHDSDLAGLLNEDSSSCFPNSAQVFLDAIKRNRSCQKFLRTKLGQIEVRIEENRKLKERVKLFKDLQSSCKKFTGRALAQGKDPRIQLISAPRTLSSRDSKVNDKVSAMHYGPMENSHVVNYRTAFENFPPMLKHKKWTEEEKENLRKGIRQQFQEMVLQISVDQLSSEGSSGDVNDLDVIFSLIRDVEITPERLREFLPKVNWDQLASLYVPSRTGAECEAQWLNSEDPLIDHSGWTPEEDKKLLFIVQEKGMTNWFDIAVSLGRNRTPFQCLARFQRSLNAHVIKSEWTNEEDDQLRIAVETFGENDWQSVASALVGRTGTQCSNRWKKTLHPNIYRVGRWTFDESKRLKVAVLLFGPKNWRKIAQFVPGRTDVQCRERWSNCMDPSLNVDKWSHEEDSRLKEAMDECGYCWAKVAKLLPPRTDSECRRRWKVLFPHEVPLLQAAKRTQKAAFVSNFVDRESERPALGPHDFFPLQIKGSVSEPTDANKLKKPKRKTRERVVSGKVKKAAPREFTNSLKRPRSKRSQEGMLISSTGDPRITNCTDVEKLGGNDTVATCSANNCHSEPAQDDPSSNFVSAPVTVTDSNGSDTRKKEELSKLHPKRNELIQKEIGTSQHDGQRRSKPRSKSCFKRVLDTNNEDSVTLASFATSVACQHDGCTKSKIRSKSFSKKDLDTNNEDSIALAASVALVPPPRQPDSKKSEARSKSCSKSVLDTNDEDNVPLACLLKPKSKRRRVQSFGIDKKDLDTINEDNITLASLVTRQPDSKRPEVRSKSCSKRVLVTNDEDDVTLAGLRKTKSKKRVQAFEIDNRTSFPSSMKVGSEH